MSGSGAATSTLPVITGQSHQPFQQPYMVFGALLKLETDVAERNIEGSRATRMFRSRYPEKQSTLEDVSRFHARPDFVHMKFDMLSLWKPCERATSD